MSKKPKSRRLYLKNAACPAVSPGAYEKDDFKFVVSPSGAEHKAVTFVLQTWQVKRMIGDIKSAAQVIAARRRSQITNLEQLCT